MFVYATSPPAPELTVSVDGVRRDDSEMPNSVGQRRTGTVAAEAMPAGISGIAPAATATTPTTIQRSTSRSLPVRTACTPSPSAAIRGQRRPCSAGTSELDAGHSSAASAARTQWAVSPSCRHQPQPTLGIEGDRSERIPADRCGTQQSRR